VTKPTPPIRSKPSKAAQALQQAVQFHRQDRLDEAARLYRTVLAAQPNHFDARHLLGVLRYQQGRLTEALDHMSAALKSNPNAAAALSNRGLVLAKLGRTKDALASFDRAVALRPDYTEALNNRGNVLQDLKQPKEALASYDRALSVKPNYAEALNNRGTALQALKRPEEALASYDRALSVKPDYAEALNNRGTALQDLKRPEEALASFERALDIRRDYPEAYYNRATALLDLGRPKEALASCDRALSVKPGYADALNNRGTALLDLKRPEEARASHASALAQELDHLHAFSGLANAALHCCDWETCEHVAKALAQHILERGSVIRPFALLGYPSSASLQLDCARKAIRHRIPIRLEPLWQGAIYQHERIRIAYVSADFRGHPTAYQMAELLEVHDRTRFEIIGISFGPDDGSDIRKRMATSFDAFIDVSQMSDLQVASLMRSREVDIAIDLMGHTGECRTEILAHRPAPVQVSYLGYPGTMGAEFIDYVIADSIVLPFDQQPYYTEKIVHLPDCYQVNDRQRRIATATPSREAMGLPARGFVFCCFNNNYKITREVFDVWMRLLREIEGSVLWLVCDNDAATRNLCAAAQARGVAPDRLIFAERVPQDQHLARHRLADLFLDTIPYNAHSTASDALWTGLPILTCKGTTFAARVAASLLNAANLPELVTQSLDEYACLAKRLACDPISLQTLKRKLADHRLTCALFDTHRFRHHIESAYSRMWARYQQGQSPESFSVEPVTADLGPARAAICADETT
jgi:protein O-GlcNAc transferase